LESEVIMDWNTILYIGMGLIVFGFGLFLYSEMKIREADRKLAQLEQSFKRSKDNG
jgi:hypothetical protein